MLIANRSPYSYFLKNQEYPLPAGSTLTVANSLWASDDELARTIESLDRWNIVSVTDVPVNYPRTSAFPDVVNLIGSLPSPISVVELSVTNEQILNSNTNPIQILPPPGAGKTILPISITVTTEPQESIYQFSSNFGVSWGGNPITIAASLLNQFQSSGPGYTAIYTVGWDAIYNGFYLIPSVENQSLVLISDASNPWDGQSGAKISVIYYIMGNGSGPVLPDIDISGGSGVFVGIDPPPSPDDGDLWWDTDDETPIVPNLSIENTEPSDGSISASSVKLWWSDTLGAPTLHAKGKDSAGTIFTATIPMTEGP